MSVKKRDFIPMIAIIVGGSVMMHYVGKELTENTKREQHEKLEKDHAQMDSVNRARATEEMLKYTPR